MQTGIEGDNLLTGLSKALVEEGEKNNKIVVLDGDLEEDCGFIPFHTAFPNRFFEMGIMEQHMVSTAAALSKSGYIPIVSTYAAFLTARANEQLYNFSSECLQGIIIGNMAGVLPATPGKSHQGFRDIACMKSIPEVLLYQPVNAQDTETILARYFRNELGRLLYIRLSMATSIIPLPTPPGDLRIGCAHKIKDGNSLLVIGIGPVVLGECLKAAGDVEIQNISVEVWNHPWLTQFDKSMYKDAARRGLPLLIVEDHFHRGGFGESLLAFLQKEKISFPKIEHIALKSFPQTGFRDEALMHFGLHRKLIAAEITKLVQ
jgi:transketolase